MESRTEDLLEQADPSKREDASVNGAKRDFSSEVEAQDFFRRTKPRLYDLDQWNDCAALSDFARFDASGRRLPDEPLSENDFMRISMTGAGKYDWVRITGIYDSPRELVITVKPTHDPTVGSADQNATSHFFTSEATNNFCLLQRGNTVELYVIGLNEKTNTDETGSTVEAVRNAAVANLGSYFGVQSGEWTKFCRSFLGIEESEAVEQ